LEFDPKGLYNSVPSCLVTLHYFVGFSHMMMRNYAEATKIFVNCLLFIQRTQTMEQKQQQQGQPQKGKLGRYDVVCTIYFSNPKICINLGRGLWLNWKHSYKAP
jgi:hypothetical protein